MRKSNKKTGTARQASRREQKRKRLRSSQPASLTDALASKIDLGAEEPWCDLPVIAELLLPGDQGYRPTRMCLGCRERQPQDCLIRLQLDEDGIVIIERASKRLPGRSAYVCPRSGCLDAVLRRDGIVFKRSKYDKIIVRLDARQAERLRYAFKFAARRMRGSIGVGPRG